jgi:glycosyltransferase involved in cell wall biosynthesis
MPPNGSLRFCKECCDLLRHIQRSTIRCLLDHLNTFHNGRVTLVAMVSVRGYFNSRRQIKTRCHGAWVLPMVPKARNWHSNWRLLAFLAMVHRPEGIIARGVFATAMALQLRRRGMVQRVCFDGRGAYGVEWEEYRIVDDDALIAECIAVEAEAVLTSDFRLAVSNALVAHWRDRFHYWGDEHVVIPCTLGREQSRSVVVDPVAFRARFGWTVNDLVLVYSGSTVGWQSLDLLAKVLDSMLSKDPAVKVLFLSVADGYIHHLMHRFPKQVAQCWLPHDQVNGALAACDIGLLIRFRSMTNTVASPTKFAEYVSAGIPVIVSEHIGDLSGLVKEHQLGWIHSDRPLMLHRPSPEVRQRLKRFAQEHLTKHAFDLEYGAIVKALGGKHEESSTNPVLVSIVIPSFNKGRYIRDTIRSVQAQSYAHWEIVVIDDASTDGTVAIVSEVAVTDQRIKLHVLERNVGANRCRNLGIEKARGEYLIFLDADDLLAPHCLEQRIRVAQKEDLDLSVFTMEVFKKSPGDNRHRWIPSSKDPLSDFFRHDLPWSVMQPIWRRSFLLRIGGFDESFKRHQDVEFHTRALLTPGLRYRTVVSEPDCFYRISEERKVLRPYELLEGFTQSSVQYHAKFKQAAADRDRTGSLLGIIHQTYLQIILNYKDRAIDRKQFQRLEEDLLQPVQNELSFFKRCLFKAARNYNLLPFRIPGVNRVIYRMITS